MGQYRIEIVALGGHGCQRELGDGETVKGCGGAFCPDCRAKAFVRSLEEMGQHVVTAELTHWPGEPCEVRDDMLTEVRHGRF